MNSERIYLDYAATTPLRAEVADTMREMSLSAGFNAGSLHFEGRQARAAIDDARDRVAAVIGARRSEVVFTSGGTEADNLALFGVVRSFERPVRVVASAIEHRAVLAALERLAEAGTEVELLPVNPEGRIDPEAFERALTPSTVLASVMYANNEVGTIQPIAELAAIARRRGVLFHTDAVAAAMWLPIDVAALGIDLLSISAHKLYGPKGVGLLYVRRGLHVIPEIVGGGQESGRRSGTENGAAIAGLARALELAADQQPAGAPRVAALRDELEGRVIASVAGSRINGAGAIRLPNLSNLSFADVEAHELAVALDLAGVAASPGSACASGSVETSHVLAAMGDGSGGGIRFSLGLASTPAEIARVTELMPGLIARLRDRAIGTSAAGGMLEPETNRARLEAEA